MSQDNTKKRLDYIILYIITLLFGIFSVFITTIEFNNISKCLSDLPIIQDNEQSDSTTNVNQCLQKNLKKNLTAAQTVINLSFILIIISITFLGVCSIKNNDLLNKLAQIIIIILLILITVYSKLTDSSSMNSVFITAIIFTVILILYFGWNNFLNKKNREKLRQDITELPTKITEKHKKQKEEQLKKQQIDEFKKRNAEKKFINNLKNKNHANSEFKQQNNDKIKKIQDEIEKLKTQNIANLKELEKSSNYNEYINNYIIIKNNEKKFIDKQNQLIKNCKDYTKEC